MEVSVINTKGKSTGDKVKLNEGVFNIAPNDHCIYLDVKRHLNAKRQGTAKVKERGEVKGTGKKPYRQKGTGNARAGDVKSPLWRHGGTIFGPRPRDYGIKLNKKVTRLARKSALSYKSQTENVTVVDKFDYPEIKTKEFLNMVVNMKQDGYKLLFVTSDYNENFYKSGYNLPGVRIVHASQLCTYDILNAEKLIIAQDALQTIDEILAK